MVSNTSIYEVGIYPLYIRPKIYPCAHSTYSVRSRSEEEIRVAPSTIADADISFITREKKTPARVAKTQERSNNTLFALETPDGYGDDEIHFVYLDCVVIGDRTIVLSTCATQDFSGYKFAQPTLQMAEPTNSIPTIGSQNRKSSCSRSWPFCQQRPLAKNHQGPFE